MSTKDDIQKTINDLFDETGKKYSELADYVGVTRQSVYNWINGKNSIDIDLVPSICSFFGVGIDEFFGYNKPIVISNDEKELLNYYRKLNLRGKKRLIEEAEMMSETEVFIKSENNTVSRTA